MHTHRFLAMTMAMALTLGACLSPTYQISETSNAGRSDAVDVAQPSGLPAPDMVGASTELSEGEVTFSVTFAVFTFDSATTQVRIDIDVDQSLATGQIRDDLGVDYFVSVAMLPFGYAATLHQCSTTRAVNQCGAPTTVHGVVPVVIERSEVGLTTISFSFTAAQMSYDDGRFNYRVRSSGRGQFDYLPNLGFLPIRSG